MQAAVTADMCWATLEAPEIAGRQAVRDAVGVAGHAVDAEHHPGVLNAAVVVVELGPHGADAGLEQLAHHLGEPVARDDLGVVVQQAHDVAEVRCTAALLMAE